MKDINTIYRNAVARREGGIGLKVKFHADIEFAATDGGDAARKLAAHFTNIANIWAGDDDDEDENMRLHFLGEMSFGPKDTWPKDAEPKK